MGKHQATLDISDELKAHLGAYVEGVRITNGVYQPFRMGNNPVRKIWVSPMSGGLTIRVQQSDSRQFLHVYTDKIDEVKDAVAVFVERKNPKKNKGVRYCVEYQENG